MAPKPKNSWLKIALATLWPAAGLYLAALIISVIVFGFVGVDDSYVEANPVFGFILNALISGLALVLAVAPFHRFLTGKSKYEASSFGITRKPKLKDIGAAALAVIPYFIATSLVLVLIGQLVPQIDLNEAQQTGFTQPQDAISYAVVFLALVVLPPVFEELIFRGFMFSVLRKQLSFLATALIVSTVFGLVHGQWNVAIDTFILSLFLSYLRERSGAIWAPIMLHALKNSIAFYYLFIVGVN